jgi:hypothetical protein
MSWDGQGLFCGGARNNWVADPSGQNAAKSDFLRVQQIVANRKGASPIMMLAPFSTF